MDVQEQTTPVAHPATVPGGEAAFVNLRDPARQMGPDGHPAVSRRATIYQDVTDEKWNDWRWQLSNRLNTLEELEHVLNLTDDEREGLSAPDKFQRRHHPYFASNFRVIGV